MKKYVRLMLGAKSAHIEECLRGNFIGADFDIRQDLSQHLYENWREFNKQFIPVWLENHPGKSKVSAGLSCGALWTVAKGLKRGDIILSPDGMGRYHIAEVLDEYSYHTGQTLPHRRTVRWFEQTIERAEMSDSLKNSTGSIGTVSDISNYAAELEELIGGSKPPVLVSTDETIEDPTVFALEKHLEDFLVANWKQTELGKHYDIFEDGGDLIGKQYPTDTGFIDILAISKDKKELLVVELKKGRASDSVVGQIQRYMGYVLEELAEQGQTVKGVIIALEDDNRIRRALAVALNIGFYRYQVSFKLFKA
jgi:restriction system protein